MEKKKFVHARFCSDGGFLSFYLSLHVVCLHAIIQQPQLAMRKEIVIIMLLINFENLIMVLMLLLLNLFGYVFCYVFLF